MSHSKIHIRQGLLLLLLTVLFVVFYSFLGIAGYDVFSERERLSEAADVDALGERLVSVFYEINAFPKRAAQEVLFFSKLSSLKNVVTEPSPEAYEKLFNDLFAAMPENGLYHEIRYIDEHGEEHMRIAYDGESYYSTPADALEKVTKDSYVKDIFNLSEGEVYISKFDFAARNHPILSRPAGAENILILRFGTPVVGDEGRSLGIVVAEIHADFFLGDIRRLSRDNEHIYLLDQDGQYLAHPDAEKEYGTLLGTENTFARDYPKVAGQVLSQFEKRRIESDTTFFSLRHIFPATSNYALSSGSRKLRGSNPDRDFFWILVSAVDKETIVSDDTLFEGYDFFMVVIAVMMILILGVLVLIFEISPKRKL